MDDDRIEIITPVPAKKRRGQELKSRLLRGFVILSVSIYCAVSAAVALKSHPSGSDLKVGLESTKVAGRLLPAEIINPR